MKSREQMNREFWEQHKPRYPFRRSSPFVNPIRPEEVEVGLGVRCLRVPLASEGVVLWGFETLEAAQAFTEKFNAPDYPIREVE